MVLVGCRHPRAVPLAFRVSAQFDGLAHMSYPPSPARKLHPAAPIPDNPPIKRLLGSKSADQFKCNKDHVLSVMNKSSVSTEDELVSSQEQMNDGHNREKL